MSKLIPLLMSVFVLVANGCGSPPATPLEKTTNAIEKFGGTVELDKSGNVKVIILWETKFADADIEKLKGMIYLQTLNLGATEITDAGLVNLKGMRSLKLLDISNTKVTDLGLRHLKGLTSLEGIRLGETEVTEAGVNELQTALPNCEIYQSLWCH